MYIYPPCASSANGVLDALKMLLWIVSLGTPTPPWKIYWGVPGVCFWVFLSVFVDVSFLSSFEKGSRRNMMPSWV